jgi:quercetin dioxygenase-like cupin family protein
MVVAGVASGLAAVVSATPGSGVSGIVAARAAFADRVDLRVSIMDDYRGRKTSQVRKAEDTVMQQIVFAPDSFSGWHSHPGPAIALIKTGQLTLYSEDDETCTGRTLWAGQAFIQPAGHVHFARNSSTSVSTEVWVTYLDVAPGSASPRIDEPSPGNCPF